MRLSCLIIDDEPMARQLLKDYCSKVAFISVQGSFSSGLEALSYLRAHTVDFIFVDIKMPDISGLELVNVLSNKTKVIFTTAFAEHAVDGFNLDAVDYLLKPFDFSRFLKAVNKMGQIKPSSVPDSSTEKDYLFVKDGRELVKLYHRDIRFIKGQKDYVQFQLPEKKVLSLMNLKDLEFELPVSQFTRIHQSYIININHVESVSNDKVKIEEVYLPISQSYRLSFRQFINSHH